MHDLGSSPDLRFPMIALYHSLNRPDEGRLARVNELADDPAFVAEAFSRTHESLAAYANTEAFHDRRPAHPIGTELDATKDVALRLGRSGKWHAVDRAEGVGLCAGELDFVYLDRELVMLRTTKPHRQPDFIPPGREMRMDLLLSARDGTAIVGEIKVKRDRDLSYALVQALTCVSLLASENQLERVRRHYRDRASRVLTAEPARFDIYLLSIPRTGGDTYLKDLDCLAPELAAALLVQPSIAGVVRRIAAIRTTLELDELQLTAIWARHAPESEPPGSTATPIDIDYVSAVRRSCRARAEVNPYGTTGWSVGDVAPARLVECFPCLSLGSGYDLRAYQYRAGGNGNGVVWAVPTGSPVREPRELGAGDELANPPRPPEALDDYMTALDGDGSAWSYLCASVLARELSELGALWHGQPWYAETIIAAPPWIRPLSGDGIPAIEPASRDEWELHQPLPNDMRPHIRSDGTTVEVRFYTYSALGVQAIYEHEDLYDPSSYSPRSRQTTIATGPGGFIY